MVEPEHKVRSESISKGRNSTFRNEKIQDLFKELIVPSQKCLWDWSEPLSHVMG